jgi:hypothetical protein
MKGKLITLTLLTLFCFNNFSYSQKKTKPMHFDKVVWFGVDFTAAKLTLVPDDPETIVHQYFKEINVLILTEPEKFNIKKYFNIKEVSNNIESVNEFNEKINPSSLVSYIDFKIDTNQVKNVINKYHSTDNSGTGLILVAENLNKASKQASYYVCFFNIETKKIIDIKRMVGSVSGFGFRNYWARTIYNVMLQWDPY